MPPCLASFYPWLTPRFPSTASAACAPPPSLILGRRAKEKMMQFNLRLVVLIAKRMKTLEGIGQIFDLTRERIRQIEAKVLRKLRHPNRNGVLKEYSE